MLSLLRQAKRFRRPISFIVNSGQRSPATPSNSEIDLGDQKISKANQRPRRRGGSWNQSVNDRIIVSASTIVRAQGGGHFSPFERVDNHPVFHVRFSFKLDDLAGFQGGDGQAITQEDAIGRNGRDAGSGSEN